MTFTARIATRQWALRLVRGRPSHARAFSSSTNFMSGGKMNKNTGLSMPIKSTTKASLSFTRSVSSTADMTSFIKGAIDSNNVVVFSKTYCPYCSATKQLFEGMGVKAEVVELDIAEGGDTIQNELHKMTGQRSVPNVFVNGQHVGGNEDTQAAARSGNLEKMLE